MPAQTRQQAGSRQEGHDQVRACRQTLVSLLASVLQDTEIPKQDAELQVVLHV